MVQEGAKVRKGWIVLLLLLVMIPLGIYLVLFRLNRFDLQIQLRGEKEMTLAVGEYYAEPGLEVRLVGSLFFREGIPVDVSHTVSGEVDNSVPGSFCLTYHAELGKLEAQGERNVLVVDMISPAITLNSDPDHFTIFGEPYVEEGYSAWDDCDGDLTDRVVRQEQDGVVTYTVEDSAGNRTTVSRRIRYLDPYSPEIQLVGDNTVYVTCGEVYQEPGWMAIDNVDGDLTDRVQVSGFVDKYLAGSYQLTYTVWDNSGNCTESYRTVVMEPKGLPETVRPSGKVIYLTFDDGPGPYTQKLLEILEKYDAKATFFVVNTEYTHVLKEIVDGGHAIGIHSVNHDYREIYASADAYFNDLLTMQQIIYDETGVMTYLMRFPGGSSNTVSRFNKGAMTYLTQAVEDMGFQYFDWNVDSNDAGGARKAEQVFDNVVAGVEQRRISVVLQHDIKSFSVDAVEKILIWGLENGYKFLALDMTSPTSHHGVNN